MLARVRRFPKIPFFQTTRSCAIPLVNPHSLISSSTHSYHVFLPLPLPLTPSTCNSLQVLTQSASLLRSTCPNQRNLPCLTTSDTHSIPSRPSNSSFVFLSFKETPHIHLIIIRSVLSSLCMSSSFI